MYVCLCHGITDRQVRDAAARGSACAGDVFARHGVRPNCGTCCETVCEILEAQEAGAAVTNAA